MSDDSDFTLDSHVQLSDLAASQLLASQKIENSEAQKEIIAKSHFSQHILKSYFNGWNLNAKQDRKDRIVELHLKRNISKIRIKRYYRIWQNNYDKMIRLHKIGKIIKVSKNFLIWKHYVNDEFERRKAFMEFILIRRNLYLHQYFTWWDESLKIAKKAKKVKESSEKQYLELGIRAFKILVDMKYEKINLTEQVTKVRVLHLKNEIFKNWKFLFRLQVLFHKTTEIHNSYQLQNYFFKWNDFYQLILRKRKNREDVKNKRKFYLRKFAFTKWFQKYDQIRIIQEKYTALKYNTQKHKMNLLFNTWLTKFNKSGYLSCTERLAKSRIKKIQKKHYFGLWHAQYYLLYQKGLSTDKSLQEYNKRQLLRLYHHWRCKYASNNYDKILLDRVNKRIRKIYFRKYKQIWLNRIQENKEEKSKENVAVSFRRLSLQLKAFNRISVYTEEKTRNKKLERAAITYRKLHLEHAAVLSWKLKTFRTKKIVILVSAVLKTWAHTIQKRKLEQWIQYYRYKKKCQHQLQEAVQTYNQRKIRFILTLFTIGTQKEIPAPLQTDIRDSSINFSNSSSDEEDLLASQIIPIDKEEEDYNFPMEFSFCHDSLPQPKMPSFMEDYEISLEMPQKEKKIEISELQRLQLRIAQIEDQLTNKIGDQDALRSELSRIMDNLVEIRKQYVSSKQNS